MTPTDSTMKTYCTRAKADYSHRTMRQIKLGPPAPPPVPYSPGMYLPRVTIAPSPLSPREMEEARRQAAMIPRRKW